MARNPFDEFKPDDFMVGGEGEMPTNNRAVRKSKGKNKKGGFMKALANAKKKPKKKGKR